MPSARRQTRRAASLALALLLCASVPAGSASAAPSASDVVAAQQQAAAARAKVSQMQAQLSQGMSSYNDASNQLASTQSQLAENTKELARIEKQLDSDQSVLGQRADYLYRTGGVGFIDVVLGAHSFDQFANRLFVVTRIADQEAQLVDQLKGDHAEATRLKAQLSAKEAQQKALLGRVAAQRDSVQSQLDREQAYVDSLSANVASLLAAQQAAASRATPQNDPSVPDPPGAVSPPKKHAPGVGLAQATVQGRSGTYWVMADEPLKYTPTKISFSGGCSVFSTRDNGTGTASGHPLRDDELVCAHKTLPFGTRIALTRGGHKVIVVVIDRGPYVSGRVLDVTPRVARLLGIDGVGDVHAEVVHAQ